MALTDLTDREAMAVMLGCTANDVRRSREMKKEKMGVPVRSVTDFTVTSEKGVPARGSDRRFVSYG